MVDDRCFIVMHAVHCSCRMGADGLKVFTEEELKVGQGGNTDLCPFDCQCCF